MRQPRGSEPEGKVIVKVDPLFEPIIPVFWDELGENIEAMRNALIQSDYDTVGLFGHKTKGPALNFGLDIIIDLGESLEVAARAHSSREVSELLDDMESYLKHIEVVYE